MRVLKNHMARSSYWPTTLCGLPTSVLPDVWSVRCDRGDWITCLSCRRLSGGIAGVTKGGVAIPLTACGKATREKLGLSH